MKIYVDGEMPKKCADCFCTNDGYGGYYDCDLYYVQNKEILDCDYYSEERPKDCPLQNLAEHDKEVRKQVVKEIRKEFGKRYVGYKWDDNIMVAKCCMMINDVLDQIEKENSDVKD